MNPIISTFGWVPHFARGFVRDLRPRWAFEEVAQPYDVELISSAKTPEHRRLQPFGQVPTYRDDEVAIFESGAIVLRIAERAGKLVPLDRAGRTRALQWLMAALSSVEPFVMALAVNDVFEADRAWSKARHAKVVEDLDGRLSDLQTALGDRQWLDGDEFTVGDLMMVSVLGGLRGTSTLDPHPKLAPTSRAGKRDPRTGRPWPTISRRSRSGLRRLGEERRRRRRLVRASPPSAGPASRQRQGLGEVGLRDRLVRRETGWSAKALSSAQCT